MALRIFEIDCLIRFHAFRLMHFPMTAKMRVSLMLSLFSTYSRWAARRKESLEIRRYCGAYGVLTLILDARYNFIWRNNDITIGYRR